jgi:hypothetical protein
MLPVRSTSTDFRIAHRRITSKRGLTPRGGPTIPMVGRRSRKRPVLQRPTSVNGHDQIRATRQSSSRCAIQPSESLDHPCELQEWESLSLSERTRSVPQGDSLWSVAGARSDFPFCQSISQWHRSCRNRCCRLLFVSPEVWSFGPLSCLSGLGEREKRTGRPVAGRQAPPGTKGRVEGKKAWIFFAFYLSEAGARNVVFLVATEVAAPAVLNSNHSIVMSNVVGLLVTV